jgi:hypothetical protein
MVNSNISVISGSYRVVQRASGGSGELQGTQGYKGRENFLPRIVRLKPYATLRRS